MVDNEKIKGVRVSKQRPQHQLRAFPDEWELIRRFARLVKHVSKEDCEKVLDALEKI